MAALNDEQVMLRDMAREWADNEQPTTAFRKVRDTAPTRGFDPAAWSTIGEMGWAGIVIPEAYGGSAFGYLSLGLVVEQLGRNLAVSPLSSTAVAADAIASLARQPVPVTFSGPRSSTCSVPSIPTWSSR